MGLTVTSFVFKSHNASSSEWVNRLFGSKAVYNLKDLHENSTASFRSLFVLPKDALHSKCSLELLGFAKLELHNPFLSSSNGTHIGNAFVVLAQPSSLWSCFYRGAHENWRYHRSYWPVFFYCPAPSPTACNKLRRIPPEKNLVGQLTMALETNVWKAKFLANSFVTDERTRMLGPAAVSSKAMAACLTIPYRTSDPAKEIINSALLYEWVRYYTSLGLKVILYDRDGNNHDAIFNSKYGNIQGKLTEKHLENIQYHPYTIHSLLDPTFNETRYDNTEVGDRAREKNLNIDDDKTSTLTQCRFEAMALYGIENVYASDFDEFLYCPNAAPTFTAQRHWLDYLTSKATEEKVDQMFASVRWLALKSNYSSPSKCLGDKIDQSLSVFECFAPYAYDVHYFYFGKSVHYGLKCPLTDFHASCGNSDCACPLRAEMQENDKCYIIHLSTAEIAPTQIFSNETKRKFESIQTELWHIVKSKSLAL